MRGILVVFAALAWSAPLTAQEASTGVPLEGFIARVARLWAAGDAGEIAAFAPRGGQILLQISGEDAEVNARHVAAALRALFSERESVSIRTARVAVAGGQPRQGFGELGWVSRLRGVTDVHRSTVYIGAVRESEGWRIREIRVLP
ncbi:MAG: hypothetical protein M3483_02575 [Gemmatimonadota bacterium]|nr:hypothetical protein [Gemmatimonadota bacterium]